MTAMPTGNEPVLFSRRRNSSVLMRGGDHIRINAIADKCFERIEDELFDFLRVAFARAL